MKVHKVTLMIVDTDQLGAKDVREVIENARYPNHCIGPKVMQIESREIEWDEGNHPINFRDTSAQEFVRLFGSGR